MNKNLHFSIASVFLFFPLFLLFRGAAGTTITLLNGCDYTIWSGILPNAGSSGFELLPGESRSLQPPPGWSGRVWARTLCTFDPYSGQGSCLTGDCGSGELECNGSGAKPPATLAEFTLGSASGAPDYYDVSLVDGYNVPMVIKARGGYGSCMTTGCATDLNQRCPNELRVRDGGACRSACMAFGTPEYCCSGGYASPATCRPSVYSQMVKSVCPRAYSYAYDDVTSTFTCAGADYTITFCPTLARFQNFKKIKCKSREWTVGGPQCQRKSSSDPQFSTDPKTIPGFGFGFGFGSGAEPNTDPTLGSSSSSDSSSSTASISSDSCPSSSLDSNSRHGPKFFIGGGQMLPNFSPPRAVVKDAYYAWKLITFVIASTTLQFHCL